MPYVISHLYYVVITDHPMYIATYHLNQLAIATHIFLSAL